MKELIAKTKIGSEWSVKLDDKDFEILKNFKWYARRTRKPRILFFTESKECFWKSANWYGYNIRTGYAKKISLDSLMIMRLWGVDYYYKSYTLMFKNGDDTDFRRENLYIKGDIPQRTDEEIDNLIELEESKPHREVRQYTFGNNWNRPTIPEDEPKWPTSMREAMRITSYNIDYSCPSLPSSDDSSFLVIKAHHSDKSEPKYIIFDDIDDLAQFLRFNNLSDMLAGCYIGSLTCYKQVIQRCVGYGIYIIEIDKPKNKVETSLDMDILCRYVDTILHLDVNERIERIKGIVEYMMFRGDDIND